MENKVYRNGRTIFLSGDIDEDSSGQIIMHLLNILAEDDAADKDRKDYKRENIKLYIKSSGGVVSDMFAIIDIMESSKTPIDTFAIGNTTSCASLLFICGNKRYTYKNTEIMIHTCRVTGLRGDIQVVSDYLDTMESKQKRMDAYFTTRTHITQKQLDEVRKNKTDWYVYADEAIKLGIADVII